MINNLEALQRSVMMRLSRGYHRRKTQAYWASAPETHRDMSGELFDFYAASIAKILGPHESAGLVLDHGAGRGEIGTRLLSQSYRVEFSEYSPAYIDELKAKGLVCHPAKALPQGRYDTIFANGVIYLEHISQFGIAIDRLRRSLVSGGRLYLLDVPVIQRIHKLPAKIPRRLVWRLTRVFQPTLGGFFMDERWFRERYADCVISDSWCDYRVHIEIRP